MSMSSYTAFASSDGPYIHSSSYNFRADVGHILQQQPESGTQFLVDAMARLNSLGNQLRSGAMNFLAPWGGDYRLASRQIFRGQGLEENQQQYIQVAQQLLNSHWFVQVVKDNSQLDLAKPEILQELEGFSIKQIEEVLRSNDLERTVDAIVESVGVSLKDYKSGRIAVDQKVGSLLKTLLGATKDRMFFKNKETLRAQITKALKKKGAKTNWSAVFEVFKKEFLTNFTGQEKQGAEDFINAIRGDFIAKGQKLKSADYGNISGNIGENLSVSIINNSSLEITIHDLGEMDEDHVVAYADQLLGGGKITKMSHRAAKGQQSGSDWLLDNGQGVVVRAQVKNSVQIMEELRQHDPDRPQVLKLQDEILYSTLQNNLQNYGGNNLSGEDWLILDYLISNMLWFRAHESVKSNRGKGYSSGVSGIASLVNAMMAKEIGYFLGVSLGELKDDAAEVVIGGSNIFFVIDNIMLLPTYIIIDAITWQLQYLSNSLTQIQVTFNRGFDAMSPSSFYAAKEEAKSPDWKVGDPYGEGVLATGYAQGNQIISSAKVDRVNLPMNITRLMQSFYGEALRNIL